MLSIVIATTRDITELKKSLEDYEVLVQKEKGLVNARNAGWRRATGDIIAFIDDDVVLDNDWSFEMSMAFANLRVSGVMGGVVTKSGNRDNDWSHPILKKFFNRIGSVQACNMAFRKSALEAVGGFDMSFNNGVGEWSEPDLVNRIKEKFSVIDYPEALLYHYPSQQGIYKERAKHSYWRMRNFMTFRKRWLKWDWNLIQIVVIFYIYWFYKFLRTGNINWLGGLCALRGYEQR